MSRIDARIHKLLASLAEIRALMVKQDATAMQLFRHPDATANQVMAAQQALAKNCKFYRDAHRQIGGLFGKSVPWRNKEYELWQRLKY